MPQNSGLAVGVDCGGTKMLGALVDGSGQLLMEHRVPTPYDAELFLDALAEIVKTLEAKSGSPVAGIGVGAAGLVDLEGTLKFGPNIGGVSDVRIHPGLSKRLPGQIVKVDNDANVAAWGECVVGAGGRMTEMCLVTLGTGIGGGIVSEGEIFRGHNGFAAEVGHMTIVADGAMCKCGVKGHWEAYASGGALGRLGREAAEDGGFPAAVEIAGGEVDKIKGEHVMQAAREGDKTGLKVMEDYAFWLAVGCASLISLHDPEVIVIGGGLVEQSDLFLDSTRTHLRELTFGSKWRPEVPLIKAQLGEKAGAIGAAMLVHSPKIT